MPVLFGLTIFLIGHHEVGQSKAFAAGMKRFEGGDRLLKPPGLSIGVSEDANMGG
jgi:hypothetical protein